jgi:gluconokinase
MSDTEPRAVILMGVAGSGKSTVGANLAERLAWTFLDADDFHPAANVQKMSNGIPLNDEDRMPWLRRLHDELD